MRTEVIPYMPEMECYICGSADVKKLCHHCGKAICAYHGSFTVPKKRFYNRSENNEYTNLGLVEITEATEGVHCEDCNHYIVSYEPIFYALSVTGIIFIISSFFVLSVWLAVAYAAIGMAIVTVSIWTIQVEKKRRHYEMCEAAPPLPVFGRFPSVTINECVEGSVLLTSDGKYLAEEKHTEGALKFSLQLTAYDREKLKKYRQKYTLSRRTDISFHTGFVVFQGTKRVRPENGRSQQVNPVPFTGQSFFNEIIHNRHWERDYKYNLTLDTQGTAGLPVQIIPTLLSEGEEWALELNVQANPTIDTSSLSFPRIEEFVLKAPGSFGEVESQAPSARITYDSEQDLRTIVWEGSVLNKQGKQIIANKVFYVRFSESGIIKPNMEVCGHLRLRFEGAASGLENARLFSPLGHPRTQDEITIVRYTHVEIDFRFHLSGLHVRKFHPETKSIEQLTAIPGNEMITRLVNALNDKNIYVQRVIENPPHMNRANAQIMNRLWVITGRRYEKATPIDFRVVAIGQEQYKDTDKPHDGNTQFEITTQGTIIKESMCTDIKRLHHDIVNIIQSAPSFKIGAIESQNQLYVDKWGTLLGTIINTGKAIARDINISATGLKVGKTDTIKKLEPGDRSQFKLQVYADKKGDVPVTITAVCEDKFGQLPPHKERCHIFVEETPSTPVISHEAHFHGSVTGSVHTGTGDIKAETDAHYANAEK